MKSLFISNILLKRCGQSEVLRDFGQIISECAVPQDSKKRLLNASLKHKSQVNYDVAIWQEPYSTCFNEFGKPVYFPIAVMEWKTQFGSTETGRHGKGKSFYNGKNGDVKKLSNYTKDKEGQEMIAIAVWVNCYKNKYGAGKSINYSIVYKGIVLFEHVEIISMHSLKLLEHKRKDVKYAEQDIRELTLLVTNALKDFVIFLKMNPDVIGREKEMKCFFANKSLLPQCSPTGVLQDFSQIVFEGALLDTSEIPDISIWDVPNKTCFDDRGIPKYLPLAILEFKVLNAWGTGGKETEITKERGDIGYTGDKTKVRGYTALKNNEEMIAFAVWLNHYPEEKDTPFIKYSVFYKGEIFENKEDIRIPRIP